METIKKPMNTAEFFRNICNILKEKGMMPDILDYALPTYKPVLMTTSEFQLRNNLDYGSSEGIYLSLWIEFSKDGRNVIEQLGTFKTLCQDYFAMETMGKLLAGFIVEGYQYVYSNFDYFDWEGLSVYAFDDNGDRTKCSYYCHSMERAIVQKDRLLKDYPKVVIRNNKTRKEKHYKKERAKHESY